MNLDKMEDFLWLAGRAKSTPKKIDHRKKPRTSAKRKRFGYYGKGAA